jgi:hypothetical protein
MVGICDSPQTEILNASFVTGIITELRMLPASSAPVILRVTENLLIIRDTDLLDRTFSVADGKVL